MNNNSPRVAILVRQQHIGPVLAPAALERLAAFAAEVRMPESPDNAPLQEQAPRLLQDADACVMSWGSPRLDAKLLDGAPNLRMLAYAAGSVRGVVSPELYDRGIIVTTAAAINGEEVSVYTLGLILCALKGAFGAARATRSGGWGKESAAEDIWGRTIGIIGAGHVGRQVLHLLHSLPFGLELLLYDPYVSPEGALKLGAASVSLEDLLSRSDVVSVHAPSIPATRHMLNASNLPLLQDRATLINTARGAIIDVDALVAELRRRPTLEALLDVTDPEEPPPAEHPYRSLPNVFLTPHLAGTVGNSRSRMGALAVEELYRHFVTGEPPLYPVTREMLEYVA